MTLAPQKEKGIVERQGQDSRLARSVRLVVSRVVDEKV